jgi:hypothetical protein
MDNGMDLATALEGLRLRLGTWQAVATAVGTSTTNIHRWRSGVEPRPEFYDGLMDALGGISIDMLGALVLRLRLRLYLKGLADG